MFTVQNARKPCSRFRVLLAGALAIGAISATPVFAGQSRDPVAAPLEAARRTRDAVQLESLKTQLQQRIGQNPSDAQSEYELALVQSYLADVAQMRKDKKSASVAVDQAVEAVQRSIQLNEKSSDAHSLLADLYGRKISQGNALFAGPRFGPKVVEENKRAMALDDKNPRVWSSLGRQYLMAPKAFGGDLPKAIESFQKSLALDPSQDETWVWLAKAYERQPDKTKAGEALQHALQLNPQNALAQEISKSLEN
jgi:tetratricopeptide (TPR) repeat protein